MDLVPLACEDDFGAERQISSLKKYTTACKYLYMYLEIHKQAFSYEYVN